MPGFFAMGFTDDPIPHMEGLCGFMFTYLPASSTDIAGYHPDYEGSPDCWYKAVGGAVAGAVAAADSYGSYEAYLRVGQ